MGTLVAEVIDTGDREAAGLVCWRSPPRTAVWNGRLVRLRKGCPAGAGRPWHTRNFRIHRALAVVRPGRSGRAPLASEFEGQAGGEGDVVADLDAGAGEFRVVDPEVFRPEVEGDALGRVVGDAGEGLQRERLVAQAHGAADTDAIDCGAGETHAGTQGVAPAVHGRGAEAIVERHGQQVGKRPIGVLLGAAG